MQLRSCGNALGGVMAKDPSRDAYLQIIENQALVDGRFSRIRRLGPTGGNGCFSLLFSALDNRTNQEVALKFYRPDKLTESYRWESFRREAQILEELGGQPDIIGWVAPLSSFVETMTSPQGIQFPIPFSYYALELAVSDVEFAIANAQWTPTDLLTAFRAMCRGVQRVHNQRVAHRDIKPGNFLLTQGGVRLSDFGTARRFDMRSQPLLLAYNYPPGDFLYAAPEISAALHDVDPEYAFGADFFSLGAILFELLSGTKLGHHLANQYLHQNLFLFAQVPVGRRQATYDNVVSSISNSYPLPNLGAQGPGVPPCIRDRADELYRRLAALDYHKRLTDFPTIFRSVDTCLLILKYEEKYRRWRKQRDEFRRARDAKRQLLYANSVAARQNEVKK